MWLRYKTRRPIYAIRTTRWYKTRTTCYVDTSQRPEYYLYADQRRDAAADAPSTIESGSIINRVHHVIINYHHHVSLANIHFNLHHDERKHLFAEWPRPRPGLGHKSGGACLGVPFYAPPPHPPPTNPHWPLPTQHVQCYVNSSIVGVNFMLTLALYSHPRTLLAGKEHLVSLKKIMKGAECPGQPYQPQSWSPFSMTYVI